MAAAARFPSLVEMLPACAFRGLTGLPCPTCGTSRALLALGRGDLAGALAVQPFVTALAALFALLLLWSAAHVAAPGCVPMAFPPPARQVVAVRAGAFALLVNWVYLLTIGQ
jgi:hypothetical protein